MSKQKEQPRDTLNIIFDAAVYLQQLYHPYHLPLKKVEKYLDIAILYNLVWLLVC